MDAIVIDEELIVYVQLGTIIGQKGESISTGLLYPKLSCVLNRKPLETPCKTRKALTELSRRHIEPGGPNGS
jgi:hypothetical protein